MCQNSTDSQKPLSGAWAKVHGQGTAQLQLSNQSPTMCQLGMSLIRTLRSDTMLPRIAGFARAVRVLLPANPERGEYRDVGEHPSRHPALARRLPRSSVLASGAIGKLEDKAKAPPGARMSVTPSMPSRRPEAEST